jgi:hypothetical protein
MWIYSTNIFYQTYIIRIIQTNSYRRLADESFRLLIVERLKFNF